MLKKFGVVTVITTALVAGGGLSAADASASTGDLDNPSFTVHHVDQKDNVKTNFKQNNTNNSNHPFHFNRKHQDDQQDGKKDDSESSQGDSQLKQKSSHDKEQIKDKSGHDQQAEKKHDQEKPSKNNATNNKQQESDKSDKKTEQKAEGLSDYEQEVVDLTNKEREKQGLSPLEADTELGEVAHEKSDDMSTNNYFSHESPTYGSPFDMLDEYDVDYQTAGENIARGQESPEKVVEGWMDSEGHRENILNEDFTHIGVGYVEDGDYWTQEFTG